MFAEVYPQCENISIDYAVLEPRSAKGEEASEIYLPAGGFWVERSRLAGRRCMSIWRDCGAGGTGAEERLRQGEPAVRGRSRRQGNYVYAPGKTVALVGVKDLVVVETDDALLITTRERSQDVGKVVAELKQAGREDLI